MVQTSAKTCRCAVLSVLLFAAILAVGLNSSLVSADPCTAQVGAPVANQQYYGYYAANVQVAVPVSATCFFQADQLYAVGNAYDTTSSLTVGSTNTVLSPINGGNIFTGQLLFSLPVSVLTHSVQFTVSIYGTQAGYYPLASNGSLLTTTSATFLITPSLYQTSYPYNPYYPGYGYYYYGSYSSTYNQNPGNYYHNGSAGNHYHNGGYQNGNSGNYHHNGGDYSNPNPGNYHNNGGYSNNPNPVYPYYPPYNQNSNGPSNPNPGKGEKP